MARALVSYGSRVTLTEFRLTDVFAELKEVQRQKEMNLERSVNIVASVFSLITESRSCRTILTAYWTSLRLLSSMAPRTPRI